MRRQVSNCKVCCVGITRFIIIIFLAGFCLQIAISAIQLNPLIEKVDYYESAPFEYFSCSQLCGSMPDGYQQPNMCCELYGRYCKEKLQCWISKVDQQKGIMYEQIKMVVIWCCLTAVSLASSVVIWKKLNKLQKKYEDQVWTNLFSEQARLFVQEQNVQSAQHVQNVSNLEEHLLVQSFIVHQNYRYNVCVICCEEFQQSKVVKLDCQHLYHRPCIEKWREKSNKCPLCKKYQS